MSDHLLFRRQFLVTRTSIVPPGPWKHLELDRYQLYTHPDLLVNTVADAKRTLVLLGEIMDPRKPEFSNAAILAEILEHARTLEEMILWLKQYAGGYVLLYRDENQCVAIPDALALREVYYCTSPDNVAVCGSQPGILVKYSSPELRETTDPITLRFYRHEYEDRTWVGDGTFFDGLKHLLPNRLLDLHRLEARRYWPNQKLQRLELKDAVRKASEFLQGIIAALVKRHSLMMAVTSGSDSRVLLAASKAFKDRIYYFINDHGLGDHHPDVYIPRQMCEGVGVPFHVHSVPEQVDAEFRKVFLANTFQATEKLLPTIYNIYFKHLTDKVNLLGVGEIGRSFYGLRPKRLSAYRVAYLLGYKDSEYAVNQCRQFVPEMVAAGERFDLNYMTMLLWEQRLGNWGSVGNSESDIAIEELNPYDSHYLYEIFMSLDDRYTTYSNNILFHELLKYMWPELLQWPINPPKGSKSKIKSTLKQYGVFGAVKQAKYQYHRLRYRLSGRGE
jgi:hypothetical protein